MTWWVKTCHKLDDLRLIPGTHIKVEEESQLHSVFWHSHTHTINNNNNNAKHVLFKYSITELHAQSSYRKDIMPSEMRLGVQGAGSNQAAFHAGIVT